MKFIDLYAGIGGFRFALENLGGECVLSAEWDGKCRDTYLHNFPAIHQFEFDVADLAENPDVIPEHDILTAGFPCQPFSEIGLKSSARHRSGKCFWDLCKIINHCRPDYFILENVRELLSIDCRKTFKKIIETLEIELGYWVYWKVMPAYPYVPQIRYRVFIVGILNPKFAYRFPEPPVDKKPVVGDIFEKNIPEKYIFDDKQLASYSVQKMRFPGWTKKLVTENSVAVAFLTTYSKTNCKFQTIQMDDGRLRVFMPIEIVRCMGLPDRFAFPPNLSDRQKYTQLGNSVVVPVVEAIAGQLFDSR